MIPITELPIGKSAVLLQINDESVATILTEMNFLPNQKITLERIAPLGDPIIINNEDYSLSIRKEEAQHIMVEPLS